MDELQARIKLLETLLMTYRDAVGDSEGVDFVNSNDYTPEQLSVFEALIKSWDDPHNAETGCIEVSGVVMPDKIRSQLHDIRSCSYRGKGCTSRQFTFELAREKPINSLNPHMYQQWLFRCVVCNDQKTFGCSVDL